MRERRHGQQTLAMLSGIQKIAILEIDPHIDEISLCRKGFYERNGFAANPFPHVHPAAIRSIAGIRLL